MVTMGERMNMEKYWNEVNKWMNKTERPYLHQWKNES